MFQKKIRTKSVKMVLENDFINNGLTSGLKLKNEKKHATQLYMVKQEKPQVLASKLLGD